MCVCVCVFLVLSLSSTPSLLRLLLNSSAGVVIGVNEVRNHQKQCFLFTGALMFISFVAVKETKYGSHSSLVDMYPLNPPVIRSLQPLLFFYKDAISIEQPTKVDMPLNQETRTSSFVDVGMYGLSLCVSLFLSLARSPPLSLTHTRIHQLNLKWKGEICLVIGS